MNGKKESKKWNRRECKHMDLMFFKNLLLHNFIGFFSYFQEVKAVNKSR